MQSVDYVARPENKIPASKEGSDWIWTAYLARRMWVLHGCHLTPPSHPNRQVYRVVCGIQERSVEKQAQSDR